MFVLSIFVFSDPLDILFFYKILACNPHDPFPGSSRSFITHIHTQFLYSCTRYCWPQYLLQMGLDSTSIEREKLWYADYLPGDSVMIVVKEL